MQTEILNLIIEFLMSPIFIFALACIIIVLVVRRMSGSRTQSGVPVLKQARKMISEVDKEKDITNPVVRTRQDIVTTKFNSQMKELGLEPSTDSGYIPVSYTPLARFLKERGVNEDTVGAILAGLMEEASEADVRAIIIATADTPGVDLTGGELEKAQELAVAEWTNAQRSRDT